MQTTVAILLGCSIGLVSPALSARRQEAPGIVASIKRNHSNAAAAFDIRPGGTLVMISGTFGALLRAFFCDRG
jgi:hypothetical protein